MEVIFHFKHHAVCMTSACKCIFIASISLVFTVLYLSLYTPFSFPGNLIDKMNRM